MDHHAPGNPGHPRPQGGMVRDVIIARAIEDLEPGTALDLGCGTGANTIMLARAGWDPTGLDASPGAIRLASDAAKTAGVDARFITADILEWEPDRLYDLVILTYALPGGGRSHKVMAAALRALAPGGTLIAVEWDHSMTERWGLDDDAFPSPADLASMVPGMIVETAESRSVSLMADSDACADCASTVIAYLRARKPNEAT
jgi:SAM-dependent methyltransferase